MPSAICHSTRERSRAKSTSPPGFMGVTSAVPQPCRRVIRMRSAECGVRNGDASSWILSEKNLFEGKDAVVPALDQPPGGGQRARGEYVAVVGQVLEHDGFPRTLEVESIVLQHLARADGRDGILPRRVHRPESFPQRPPGA